MSCTHDPTQYVTADEGTSYCPACERDARAVAYVECLQAQEALYWEARRRGWPLDDKAVGDILRLVAPILREHDVT